MSDAGSQIDTMLRHLGSGRDFQDFPGTKDEKLGLILTAAARGRIAWSAARGRFELTPIGLRPETPRRGFGLASLVVGTTVGAAIAAGAFAALWLPADASDRPAGRQAPAPVSRPVDLGGGLRTLPQTASASPVVPKVFTDHVLSAQHEMPMEQARVAPKVQTDLVPAAQPIPTEPARVAEQPVPEQPSATATPTRVKQAAVKKPRHQTAKVRKYRTKQAAVMKPRHKTAKVRKYRTWAGASSYRDERYVR
jgi:hypothetical protein